MPKLGEPIQNEDERKGELKGVVETFRNKYGDTIGRAAKRRGNKTRRRS